MKISSLPKKILGRVRWAAHWRCAEPIVVFESDDWGMQRAGNLEAFKPYGKPKDWTAEITETMESLQALYKVLESQQDRSGRPAVFTANFITANPDFDAIEANNFTRYVDTPIGADKQLLSGWKEGLDRQVFYPQYHGRSHIWVNNWLKDLRQDAPGARILFQQRQNGGLGLLQNADWRYHSEYMNWRNGEMLSEEAQKSWITTGLNYFEDAFGFRPQSAIAPHYILPKAIMSSWAQNGVRFVQGGNYHIFRHPQTGDQVNLHHALGEKASQGLIYLARNVRFEPRPSQKGRDLEPAWRQVEQCFKAGIPAVIDTHRINYTGPWQVEARQALAELLERISCYQPLYLTSVELGEAIQNNGRFQDVMRHITYTLSVRDSTYQKTLRQILTETYPKTKDLN